MELLDFEGMEYLVRFPDDYQPGEKRPTILFLHGAGSRGDSIAPVQTNAFFNCYRDIAHLEFVTIAPHCREGSWNDYFERLKRLAEKISKSDFCDPDRLYLVGTSMGGYGAWALGCSIPEYFAAMMPLCGGGAAWNTAPLKDMPIWAIHGAVDCTVDPTESLRMVKAANRKGAKAQITVYPELAHNVWDTVYSDKTYFDWLLSHRLSDRAVGKAENEYADAKKFG